MSERDAEFADPPFETVVVPGDGETLLVIASIHGNETAGTPIVERLIEEARRSPGVLGGRRLVAVPVANPDGVAAGTRGNAAGVDLNRNWPAENYAGAGDAPLSEPETRELHRLVHKYRPARVLVFHQPLDCIDHDGPAADLAAAMAAVCDLPAKKLGGRPGSMGSYLGGDLGLPTITFEMRRDADGLTPEQLWDRYGDAVLVFVRNAGPAEG